MTSNDATLTPSHAELVPNDATLTSNDAEPASINAILATNTAELVPNDVELARGDADLVINTAEVAVFKDSTKNDFLTEDFKSFEISPISRSHEIPLEPKQLVCSKSLRVHLLIKSTDLGLEMLYEELRQKINDAERILFVKTRLNELIWGLSASTNQILDLGQTMQVGTSQRNPSFKIVFRLSGRDIGLGKLYAALAKLASPMARNVHVKRFLFEAYNKPASGSGTLPVPSLPALISLTSPVPLPLSSNSEVMSPWSNPAQLPVKRSEEEHQLKVKQRNAANLKSFGYKPECVLTKSLNP